MKIRIKFLILLITEIVLIAGCLLTARGSGKNSENKHDFSDSLEINGSLFAEIGENVTFRVTSKGLSVKDATVNFAGHEKKTDENGTVAFQIDFGGPFKAVAEKNGHKSSALLWVFPKGNQKFRIRAIREHGDALSTPFSAYRLAGANWISLKAYYTYDDQGNIYPVVLIEKEEKGMGMRVQHEIHQKSLAWQITKARDWGIKNVYLQAQLMPPSWDWEGKEWKEGVESQDVFGKEEERRYSEQIEKEALILAEFAEKQGVGLLDPFGSSLLLGEKDFQLYQGLLPKIREKFSGALGMNEGQAERYNEGLPFEERNYTGFDYVLLRFNIGVKTEFPKEMEAAIREYLKFGEYLKEKYGIKIMPVWVASFDLHEEDINSYRGFFDSFDNLEEAKVWLIDAILKEASNRNIDGVSAYELIYFGGRQAAVAHYPGFYIWQSKAPLNVVKKYFSVPWNKEAKKVLLKLQHARLAANSLEASFPEFAGSTELRNERALKAFQKGDYALADSTILSTLQETRKINNPLNISIDGNENEWNSIDPVYFNPSRAPPWYNMRWYYGVSEEEEKNLRSVYALNDPQNLYLMFDFYGRPLGLTIDVDSGGDGSYEFQIKMDGKKASLWKINYEDSNRSYDLVTELECASDRVTEIKMPLELIREEQKIGLAIFNSRLDSWGDVEIDVVDWKRETIDRIEIVILSIATITMIGLYFLRKRFLPVREG